MALSDDMIAVAIRLIDLYGSTVTVKEPSSTSYANGDVVTVAGTSTDIKAHVEKYESEQVEGLILEGDIRVLTKNDAVFTKNTTIVFKGLDYSIINIIPTYLQDQVIIYEIQVRN